MNKKLFTKMLPLIWKKYKSLASLGYKYFKVFIYFKLTLIEWVLGTPKESYGQSLHWTLAFMRMRGAP